VLRFAVPAGLACALAAFLAYGLARMNDASDQTADRSTATLSLFLAATWVLALIARPYTWWRAALVVAMVVCFALAAAVPFAARFFALDLSNPVDDAVAFACAAVAAAIITVVYIWQDPRPAVECPSPPVVGTAAALDLLRCVARHSQTAYYMALTTPAGRSPRLESRAKTRALVGPAVRVVTTTSDQHPGLVRPDCLVAGAGSPAESTLEGPERVRLSMRRAGWPPYRAACQACRMRIRPPMCSTAPR
jgi:hypothetical protein